MKSTILTVFLLVIAITYVEGASSCYGKVDKTFCPEQTEHIRVDKESLKNDNDKIKISILCKDNRGIRIAECEEVVENPYPGVQIKTVQIIGTYYRKVHETVTTATNVSDEVETFA